jgi:hypothetical protein
MIGFNHLGKIGRLGNQMFQCAALIGIAKYRDYDYCIPDNSSNRDYGGYHQHELQGCFKMSEFDGKYGYVDGDVVQLDQYHFCQELMDECPDNCTLFGYFESEKYFKHVEGEIRNNYQFKDEIIESCLKYGESILDENPVAVTIRRGDFLAPHNVNRHKVCGIDYYEKALKKFDNRSILVFSDDIEWCKEQTIFTSRDCKFVENNSKIYKGHFDLCLLSMCNDFIIANSTFTWWGAWLSKNKNKKVIAPKEWFGPELKHHILDDQIPEEWERI